jgi:hypothetical protein
MERRDFLFFIGLAALSLMSCKRRYVRPGGLHDLGPLEAFTSFPRHVRDRSMLVYWDELGLSVLSTRCTYDGCELSYQRDAFLCMCCKSMFDLKGNVLRGPTVDNLPWFELRFADGKLYADSSRIVNTTYRLNLSEINEQLKEITKNEEINIPDILLGDQREEKTHVENTLGTLDNIDAAQDALNQIDKAIAE